jgi:V/A-type H+-transporting ATPase subunit E
MTSEDENLQALSRAVEEQAREEAGRILAEAKAKAEAASRHAREEADAERKNILDRAAREADSIRGRQTAAARMKARAMILERRGKLLEAVFAAAQDRLASIQDRPDYGQIVRRLIREALPYLAADTAILRADPRTSALLTDSWLAAVSAEAGVRLQSGPPLEKGTGVIAETADGHRRFDNTLETRLERMRSRLGYPVYKLLIGQEP